MLPPPTGSPSPGRRALLAAGSLVILAAAGQVADTLFRGGLQAPFDFAEYWAAGHLNLSGRNPYDGTLVRETQQAVGLDDTAIMMWNPPWALSLVMPIGGLPFRGGYAAWVLVSVALVVGAAELLWRGLGGDPSRRWVAYLLALTFVPTVFLIGSGQITGFVLFGLAGYLAAATGNRPLLAGAAGALTAVKPHLLGLFALGLAADAARGRVGRRVVAGGAAVGLLACVPPTLANPDVWSQYAAAATGPSSADHHDLTRWTPPLAGWWLRTAVPGHPFWVQWLPLAVAAGGFLVWELARPRPRPRPPADRSADRLPWVVGVSLLASPYGAWPFDLVLLLVPVLAAAVRVSNRPTAAGVVVGVGWLAAVNAVAMAMMVRHISSEWYVWVTPAVLLGCLVASRLADSPRAVATAARGPTGA